MSVEFSLDMLTGERRIPWWKQPEDKHISAHQALYTIQNEQQYRTLAFEEYTRTYTNRIVESLTAKAFGRGITIRDRIRLNVVRSAIDALTAQIATNRPRVQYLTIKGNLEERYRAKNLSKFTDGVFYENKVYSQAVASVFPNACVYGTGYFYPHACDGKIKISTPFPQDVWVDDMEVQNGSGPLQLYWLKLCDRDELIAEYPDKEVSIVEAGYMGNHAQRLESEPSETDMCSVLECWHLSKNPKLSRHAIFISNDTLMEEEWKRDHFPLIPFRWSPHDRSWDGIGVVEYGMPIQEEITYLAQKIQRAMTANTGRVWKAKGSSISKIGNVDWGIYEYSGNKPPVFQTQPSLSGEFFSHVDRLRQYFFQDVGISQMQAQSLKPAGLDSGAALLAFNDIGTKRFQHTGQRWEQTFLDLAEEINCVAREMDDSDLKVLSQGDKGIEEICWGDVSLEQNKYVMRTWPSNLLSETPAGKMEDIMRLGQAAPQFQPFLPRLMTGIPDVDSIAQYLNAPLDLIESQIDAIIDKGIMEEPTPEMDLQTAKLYGQLAIQRGILDEVEEENIEMLRVWLTHIDALIETARQAQAPMQIPAQAIQPGQAQEAMPPEMQQQLATSPTSGF